MAQAVAPLAFGLLIDVMGAKVLIVSSALSLSALAALFLIRANGGRIDRAASFRAQAGHERRQQPAPHLQRPAALGNHAAAGLGRLSPRHHPGLAALVLRRHAQAEEDTGRQPAPGHGTAQLGRLRLAGRDPDAGEHSNQPDQKVCRDRLADEQRRQQGRGNRIDRHGIGNAGRRRPRQRHHPEDEGERAAADAEIDAGNPLRRREVIERRKATLHEPRQHQHGGARAHADGEKAKRAGALHQRARQHVVERHAEYGTGHDQLAAPGAGRALGEPRGQRSCHTEHGDADADILRAVSRSTPRIAPTTMVWSGSVASARLARAAVV